MSHDIIMPVLGMNQDTGIIAEWLKQPGEWVASGDVVMSVETDKAVQDIESRYEGYLSHVKYEAGAEVPVGDVVAQLTAQPESDLDSASSETDTGKAATTQSPVAEKAPAHVTTPQPSHKTPQPSHNTGLVKTGLPSVGGKILASPKAKSLLRDRGIAISDLTDDGVAQPIHAADVMAYEPKIRQKHVASSMGKIHSVVSPDAIVVTEEWLASDELSVSRAELLAVLVAGALRYSKVIESGVDCSVVIPADDCCLLNPDLVGLGDLQKSQDENGFVSLWDFTESSIAGFELDSDAKLNVSVFGGDQWTVELRFDTNVIRPKQAIVLLSEITRRISQPLRQLL